MPQLHAQNSRLDFVQAVVPARLAAEIFRRLAVVAQRSNALREFRRIRNDHARVAVSTQILCGIEAEARGIAHRSGRPAFVGSADRLGIVLNHRQSARPSERQDWIHVRREAIEMDDYDGARSGGYAAFQLSGIDVVGFRPNVRKNRYCSKGAYGTAGGYKRERGKKHFVTSLHTAGSQGQYESVGPGANSHT